MLDIDGTCGNFSGNAHIYSAGKENVILHEGYSQGTGWVLANIPASKLFANWVGASHDAASTNTTFAASLCG